MGVVAPHRVRLLCAYDPAICRAVRAVFVRAVANSYRRAARRAGLLRANSGAVVVDQHFDSALRLDLHFHGLFSPCGPGAVVLGAVEP
jgi:hypothetical protein